MISEEFMESPFLWVICCLDPKSLAMVMACCKIMHQKGQDLIKRTGEFVSISRGVAYLKHGIDHRITPRFSTIYLPPTTCSVTMDRSDDFKIAENGKSIYRFTCNEFVISTFTKILEIGELRVMKQIIPMSEDELKRLGKKQFRNIKAIQYCGTGHDRYSLAALFPVARQV